MDNKANYIVFHPRKKRQKVTVSATIINILGEPEKKWIGNILVDKIGVGNEDPFVFNTPWLYSYCHASQLRRKERKDCFIQPCSIIIFVDGHDADKEKHLTVDTVFIVENVLYWGKFHKKEQMLPEKYINIMYNENSELWKRHFQFPFLPEKSHHKSVTHSYESKMWKEGETQFSFLPLNIKGQNISIPISNLDPEISKIIANKRKGKYPILFLDHAINSIMKVIEENTVIKVVGDITLQDTTDL